MRTLPCLLPLLCAVVLASASLRNQKPYRGFHSQEQAITASKGDLYFKDCREQICHQGLYDGYNCRAGYCDYVCDYMGCYESSRVKSAYAKANRSQKSRASWPRRKGTLKGKSQFKGKSRFGSNADFSSCTSEYCKSGDYEGYDCKMGHCGYVCKGADCYLD
ncbi:unnamed protein product [Schistocephalus solidus]|uniref:WAP domain-containing protein n=2 Tax=Schistocephalus solidus TaxID=70667 RepID=A0A183SV74_SCHSO|nr:unnamed protein product [Schistocephalus solidus]